MAYDLERFVTAQAPVIDAVLAELEAGRKRTHWMWFVFPQLRGLGHSQTAQHFGLDGRGEAAAYLAHAVLGPRLVDCARLVCRHAGATAHDIFGSPDDLKLRSCATLFAGLAQGPFTEILDRFYGGQPDPRTLERLHAA